MIQYDIDDSRLQELWDNLSEKSRRKALRGALLKKATIVRRAAIANLRSAVKSVRDRRGFERGVRSSIWKRKIGFTVSAAPGKGKYKKGFYKTRSGREMPVLKFLEYGATARMTRGKKGKRHSTGTLKAIEFMKAARDSSMGSISSGIADELKIYIQKVAAKAKAKVQ